jgi:hypothetical protein
MIKAAYHIRRLINSQCNKCDMGRSKGHEYGFDRAHWDTTEPYVAKNCFGSVYAADEEVRD